MNLLSIYIPVIFNNTIKVEVLLKDEIIFTAELTELLQSTTIGNFKYVDDAGDYREFNVISNTSIGGVTFKSILIQSSKLYFESELIDFTLHITSDFILNEIPIKIDRFGAYLYPITNDGINHIKIINSKPYTIAVASSSVLTETDDAQSDSVVYSVSRTIGEWPHTDCDIDLTTIGYNVTFKQMLDVIIPLVTATNTIGYSHELTYDTGAGVVVTDYDVTYSLTKTIPIQSGRILNCKSELLGQLYPARIETDYTRTDTRTYYVLNPIKINDVFYDRGSIVQVTGTGIAPFIEIVVSDNKTIKVYPKLALFSTGFAEMTSFQDTKSKLVKTQDMSLLSGSPLSLVATTFLELTSKVIDSVHCVFANKHMTSISEIINNDMIIKSEYVSDVTLTVKELISNTSNVYQLVNKGSQTITLLNSIYEIRTSNSLGRYETIHVLNIEKFTNRYLEILKDIQIAKLNENDIKYVLLYTTLLTYKSLLASDNNDLLLSNLVQTIKTLNELCTEI